MKRYLLILIALACASAGAGESVPLQRGDEFSLARKALLAKHWNPVIPKRRETAPTGIERELLRNQIGELDSCSVDARAYCIFHYSQGTECLTVFTAGEKVKSMKVTSWRLGCA